MEELPDGWADICLSEIADWSSGGTPSRKNPEYYTGEIPWVKTGNLGNRYLQKTDEHITQEAINNSSAKVFPKGSVAIAMYGATIGKISIFEIEAATNQACGVGQPNCSTNSVFLYYLLCNEKKNFIAKGKGGAQPNISQTIIKAHKIWFPPLNEQIRIANKLDSLLAKVEAAQTRLDKIPTLLKRFRQSVLAAATSGELTKEWRKENRLSNPIKATISSIGSLSGGKTPSKSNKAYWENGNIPWVSPKDMKSDVIYSSIDMITELALNKASMKLYPKNSVLMVTRSGILAHSFPVVVAKVPVTVNQDLKVFSANDEQIDTDYLAIALRGNSHKILRECSKDGTTVSSIETSKLERFEFDFPVLEEQKQIVRRVESLFTLADKVEKQYQQARQRTDKLSQSLLAKAFKGELVPQDPNDEPAEKLLARIQAEREKLKPAKKPRKRRMC